MFHQGGGVLAGWGGAGGPWIIAGQELHEGRGELFSGPARALALEPMPLPVVDGEAALQLLGQGQGFRRPGGIRRAGSRHGGCEEEVPSWRGTFLPEEGDSWMAARKQGLRRLSRLHPAPRLLHHLQALLALAGRPAVPTPSGDQPLGRSERRRRQHLALSQRLLDPLPEALRSKDQGADRFWTALRWGGCGMVLAQWLGR